MMFSSALAFARRGSLESRTPDKRRLCVEHVERVEGETGLTGLTGLRSGLCGVVGGKMVIELLAFAMRQSRGCETALYAK